MKNKIVGLDIGSSSIKVASLKKNGNDFVIESVAVSPATPKGLASESPADLQELSQAIKKLIASAKISVSDIAISIPETQVYTRVIRMPDLSPQELSAALKFEMEQYVPLPLDQARTDWEILSHDEHDGKKTIDVMIVAAPLTTLEKYEKLLNMSGLKADVVETQIVSEHRALLPLVEKDLNLIVHIGATATNVAVIKNGIIKMVFTVAIGGAAITRAISLDFGIDVSQAETYKTTYGLKNDAFNGKLGNSLLPILQSISSDIKKALLSYREKENDSSVKQVVLSGGTALLPGIQDYFAKDLETQVVLGNGFSAYNIQNVPQELQSAAPAYNVVFGLALRSLL